MNRKDALAPAEAGRAEDAVGRLDRGEHRVIDLLAARAGPAGQHHVAGMGLHDPSWVGTAGLSINVLGADALSEEVGQIFGIATKADLQSLKVEHRFEMGHDLNADGDALAGNPPGVTILRTRVFGGMPEREQISANGRTARDCRLSKLLPARGPGGPERTVDARREVGRKR